MPAVLYASDSLALSRESRVSLRGEFGSRSSIFRLFSRIFSEKFVKSANQDFFLHISNISTYFKYLLEFFYCNFSRNKPYIIVYVISWQK